MTLTWPTFSLTYLNVQISQVQHVFLIVYTRSAFLQNILQTIVKGWFYFHFSSTRYTISVTVSEQQPYQVREYVWCLNFPPRCSKYKIKYKTVHKKQDVVKNRPIRDCCKGYTKSNTEDRCIPVCSEECLHGLCTAPDTCQCTDGYGGPHCDICKCEIRQRRICSMCPLFRDSVPEWILGAGLPKSLPLWEQLNLRAVQRWMSLFEGLHRWPLRTEVFGRIVRSGLCWNVSLRERRLRSHIWRVYLPFGVDRSPVSSWNWC